MISILIFIGLCAGIVTVIDLYNNRWYDRYISTHRIVVEYRVRDMHPRDINYLLEHTGRFIELNNSLYVNNTQTVVAVGEISKWRARAILVSTLTCGW